MQITDIPRLAGYITMEELANLAGMTKGAIWQHILNDRMPNVVRASNQKGGLLLIPTEDANKFLDWHKRNPRSKAGYKPESIVVHKVK